MEQGVPVRSVLSSDQIRTSEGFEDLERSSFPF